jgi:hypothetical protein
MNPKDIAARLSAIAAGHDDDPELLAATIRRDGVQRQVDTLMTQLTTRHGAHTEQRLAAEAAILAGEKRIDNRGEALRREIVELESDLSIYTGALTTADRRVTELAQARGERIQGTLWPIFVDLVAELDRQVAAVGQVERLLEHAHQVANAVLPGSNVLAQGYGATFAPPQAQQWWRDRVRNAGLLLSERRVA